MTPVGLERRVWAVAVAAVVAATVAVLVLPEATWSRWLIALLLAGALSWWCWCAPSSGLLITLGWLFFLGGTRRVVSWQLVDVARDPLLLVGPAGLAALFARAVRAGAFRRWTGLAVLVAGFSGLCLVSLARPGPAGLVAGVAGLLFWLVPMVWFWVGRRLVDDRLLERVILLLAVAGAVSAVYGLVKAGVGVPPWDAQWIRDHGYVALYVGGHQEARPFGVAASAVEFGLIVALGAFLALLFAVVARRRADRLRLVLWALALVTCCAALVVSGVRTAVAMLGITVVACLVIRLRPGLRVVGGVIVLAAVAYGALWIVPAQHWSLDGTTGSVRRIVVGLRNPFDREDSTLLGHMDLVGRGLRAGFEEPLGEGPGATNLAGERFSDVTRDTEFDISNGAVAFGIAGIVFTAAILGVGMALAVVAAWRRPDLRHLAVLGVLILSFRFWWNGGHYFLSAVVWLGLGWLDARSGWPRSARSVEAEASARAE